MDLTALDFFVGLVGAIGLVIAQFIPLDAFWPSSGRSFWAEKLVVRASNQSAVGLVRIISAVGETVASPSVGETDSVVTSELAAVTRREICKKA